MWKVLVICFEASISPDSISLQHKCSTSDYIFLLRDDRLFLAFSDCASNILDSSLCSRFSTFLRKPVNTASGNEPKRENVFALRNHWLHANRVVGERISYLVFIGIRRTGFIRSGEKNHSFSENELRRHRRCVIGLRSTNQLAINWNNQAEILA